MLLLIVFAHVLVPRSQKTAPKPPEDPMEVAQLGSVQTSPAMIHEEVGGDFDR